MAEGLLKVDGGEENVSRHSPVMKIKHDWYQTEAYVVVTVLAKNVDKNSVMVEYGRNSLDVCVRFPESPDYMLHLDLAHPIDPEKSVHKVLASKIEIKLKKCDGIHWAKLEGSRDEAAAPMPFAASVPEDSAALKYPSSAPNARDWNRVVLDEAEGPPEGEAALNELFRKIYVDGTDEVKRAMNKSFQESGGTVLSTNWNEVSRQKIDVKPPDGLEWRKWE
ncbi:protein SGT1 homolog [Bacillus rossius redtenbacheri]|uniref:protein SGT1 homolog n=1 Tax=Bacillus rossius redtenbacheri TaxID=93214 RepID=UPI002FDE8265